jgi:hypothetical protein
MDETLLHPEKHHTCLLTTEMNPFGSVVFDVEFLYNTEDGAVSWFKCKGCNTVFKVNWPDWG